MRSRLMNNHGKSASLMAWLIYGAICALIGMALSSYAYTGKIWTNTADAFSVDAGITYDSYGNWALSSSGCGVACDGTLIGMSDPPIGTSGWQTSNCKIPDSSGPCLAFDSSNDTVSIPHSSKLNTISNTNNSITIEAWVYITSLSNSRAIVSKMHTVNSQTLYLFQVNSTGKLYFQVTNGTSAGYWTSTNNEVSLNTWYHLAVVHTFGNSASTVIYKNGSSVAGSWVNGNYSYNSSNTNPVYIGRMDHSSFPNWMSGRIDEVRIYSSIRSSSNISNDYSSITECSSSDADLVACWRFNEGSGTTTINSKSLYLTISPVITFTAFDLGYNVTFDMSSFKSNEVLTIGSIKYQYRYHATDCTSGSWNGTWLTRLQIQELSDIASVECIQFKAQLNSNGTQFARVDHLTIGYSPYKTASSDIKDAYLSKLNPTYNYGMTNTAVNIGYDTGSSDYGNYIAQLNTYDIPRDTINYIKLWVYVEYVSGKWESSGDLTLSRLMPDSYWREGTKTGATADTHEATWGQRRYSSENWYENVGATPNALTLYNSPTWVTSCKLPVDSPKCISFDGVNDYGKISSLSASQYNKLSIEFWGYKDSYLTSGYAMWFINSTSGSNTRLFMLEGDNTCLDSFQLSLNGDVGASTSCYSYPSIGWHHYVAIFDKSLSSNEVDLYIDGILQTPTSRPENANNTNTFGDDALYLSAGTDGTTNFNNIRIDEFVIHDNVSLDLNYISSRYNAGVGKELYNIERGIIHAYHFNEISGITAYNLYDSPSNPTISLGANFTSGWYSITLPIQWVKDWRDLGGGQGIVLYTRDTTSTHVAKIYPSENTSFGAYFEINYSLNTEVTKEDAIRSISSNASSDLPLFWPGQWHLVQDSQGGFFTHYLREDRYSEFLHYDGHLWAYAGEGQVGASDRLGALLKTSDGYIHWMYSASFCTYVSHKKSTYPDDLSIFSSLGTFGSGQSVVDKSGFAVDSSDKLYAILQPCAPNTTLEYWTKPIGGSWTQGTTLVQTHASTDYAGTIYPSYPLLYFSEGTMYLAYTWSNNITSGYDKVIENQHVYLSVIYSTDGGSTWKDYSGGSIALPIYIYNDKLIPTIGQAEVWTHAINKHGSDLYLGYFNLYPIGSLGTEYINYMGGTDSDYNFGDGTTWRVGQTYTASNEYIGRGCFKLRKVGSPTQKVFVTIHNGDTNTSAVRYADRLISPSEVTTSYQDFCSDFTAIQGDMRITITVLPQTGGDVNNKYQIAYDSSNPYSGGTFRAYTTTWATLSSYDIKFSLWRRTYPTTSIGDIVKLSAGNLTNIGTPSGFNAIYSSLIEDTSGKMHNITLGGTGSGLFDEKSATLNVYSSEWADAENSWVNLTQLTTNATSMHRYLLSTRADVSSINMIPVMYHSSSPFQNIRDIEDIFFLSYIIPLPTLNIFNEPYNNIRRRQ